MPPPTMLSIASADSFCLLFVSSLRDDRRTRLFADQFLHDLEVLRLVTGLVTAVHVLHDAVAIDDDRSRHRFQVVKLGNALVLVDEDRETHARFLGHVRCRTHLAFDVHAEHGEARVVITLVDAIEQRQLLPARTTPARPEIDEHDLTLVFVEPEVRALETLEREVRSRLLDAYRISQQWRTCNATSRNPTLHTDRLLVHAYSSSVHRAPDVSPSKDRG